MADYFTTVFEAVSRNKPSTAVARREIYERSRETLVSSLHNASVSDELILVEEIKLEKAILRAEEVAATEKTENGLSEIIEAKVRDQIRPNRRSLKDIEELERLKSIGHLEDELYQQRENERTGKQSILERIKSLEKKLVDLQIEKREAALARRNALFAQLAEMASPSPHIASDGRLTAGTNIPYDIPSGNDDLATLPLRQRGLIKIILSDLPPNAPTYLRTAFKGYDEELLARGSQPILGLLNDITSIVETCINSPTSAREWLEDGMHAAVEKFLDNHSEMRKHFPLDPKRERAYEQISIDDDGANGAALSRPFQDVASASGPAGQAGITTDDFVRIIDKMTDYAKTISTLPINGQITSARKTVSAKKRLLLSGLGFFERAYNLLGSTASLVSQPEAVALAAALRRAIELLGKFVISL